MIRFLVLVLIVAKVVQSNNSDMVDFSGYYVVLMEEILDMKDVRVMLKYREGLFLKILKF